MVQCCAVKRLTEGGRFSHPQREWLWQRMCAHDAVSAVKLYTLVPYFKRKAVVGASIGASNSF